MKIKNGISRAATLAALLAIGAVWIPARSNEQPTDMKTPRLVSGLVGFADGQTARVNVVNWGERPVQVELVLFDAEGKPQVVKNGIVAPGQSLSDEFSWPCCGWRADVRGEVRLVDQQERKAFEQLVATLEIFDNQTGRTTVLLPYILIPPIP